MFETVNWRKKVTKQENNHKLNHSQFQTILFFVVALPPFLNPFCSIVLKKYIKNKCLQSNCHRSADIDLVERTINLLDGYRLLVLSFGG